MKEEKQQILDMLAAGKITASEASDLLDALENDNKQPVAEFKDKRGRKKNLRVDINAKENDGGGANVKVNLPLSLIKILNPIIKSGIISEKTRKELDAKGVDIDNIVSIIDTITDELADTQEDIVNVNANDKDDGATVRIYVD
ncbi:MAG: hypothetical protein PHW77_03165 [Eubacteriales bacterium]|nr:hypothetical protein [Eubacteriales bacterium]